MTLGEDRNDSIRVGAIARMSRNPQGRHVADARGAEGEGRITLTTSPDQVNICAAGTQVARGASQRGSAVSGDVNPEESPGAPALDGRLAGRGGGADGGGANGGDAV